MLSRALSLATVTLLFGCLAAIPVRAQNLDAGKSPSQIFSGTCAACHKSPRGLLKTVPAGSLPGFLRQHYTTGSDMAKQLGAFLISNGATDTRVTGTKPTQQPKDVKPDAQPQQAARPDADGATAQGDPGRQGRNAKRQPRPGEAPDAARPAVEGEPAVQAAIDRGPDGRKSAAKQKLGKKGKGGEEPAKTDAGKTDAGNTDTAKDEPAKGEPAKDEASKSDDTAKTEGSTPESAKPSDAKPSEAKPSGEGKSETANVHPPKETGGGETPALRADPVPAVTPAPISTDGDTRPVQTATPAPPAASGPSATGPTGATEPAAAPPAVTASVPPPPPVAPAGPPAPPISQ